MTPDQWTQLVLGAAALVGALFERKRQNGDLIVKQTTARKLADHELAVKLAAEVETIKTVIGIHKEDMRVASGKIAILTHDVERLQATTPELIDLMQKVHSHFERKKAAPLEEHPVGQGMTAIKTKKESD